MSVDTYPSHARAYGDDDDDRARLFITGLRCYSVSRDLGYVPEDAFRAMVEGDPELMVAWDRDVDQSLVQTVPRLYLYLYSERMDKEMDEEIGSVYLSRFGLELGSHRYSLRVRFSDDGPPAVRWVRTIPLPKPT